MDTTKPNFSGLRRFVNWQRVRRFGKLSILNRLSFATLVLVPILAVCYPTIRATADTYNLALVTLRSQLRFAATVGALSTSDIESSGDIEGATAPVEDQEAKPESEYPVGQVDVTVHTTDRQTPLVGARIDARLIDSLPQTSMARRLPQTPVVVFFAAFFILIGDTLLQWYCPEEVQRRSLIEYVEHERSQFASAPSEATWRRAVARIAHPPQEVANPVEPEHEAASDGSPGHGGGEEGRLAMVEQAAAEYYETLSRRHLLPTFLCTLCYGGGFAGILYVLIKQSYRVASAAGYL